MFQKYLEKITAIDSIKETLFPLCFFPLKCISKGKSFISSSGQKYLLWISEENLLEIVKFEESDKSSYPINSNATSGDNINLDIYIPTFFEFQNPEKSIFLWDNEANSETLNTVLEQINFAQTAETEVMSFDNFLTSHRNFFASNLQYLPIAFNLYQDKNTGHKFIQILDLSRINEGIITPISSHQYPANDFIAPINSLIQKQELFKDAENNIIKMTFSLFEGRNEQIEIQTSDTNKIAKNFITKPYEDKSILESDEFKNLLLRTRGFK